jgi:hypothetical protein
VHRVSNPVFAKSLCNWKLNNTLNHIVTKLLIVSKVV